MRLAMLDVFDSLSGKKLPPSNSSSIQLLQTLERIIACEKSVYSMLTIPLIEVLLNLSLESD